MNILRQWKVMTHHILLVGFDAINMLPDEAVYKPKKKEQSSKTEGLENFMEFNE